ncbi:MAG: PD-(D/E)XK nuclease family protein [Candidatus Sungbacteria bacterium]|nr:PD-(D/E)XK nuclease family protein [Candidatus Sungbacteria bacterium]
MRTSYSAIQTYLQCPQRYEFQEIGKIRVPKSREAIFGTLVHSTLHFMFQRDPLFPTLDEVVGYFQAHWPALETFNKDAAHDVLKQPWAEEDEKIYFEQGVKMLKRFYEKNAPWNFHIVDLESRFELTLTDEKTSETHVLAGIIDRIDKLDDGTYEIIDYKTGRRMPSQDSLNQDLQLSLYSAGLQKRWPQLKTEDIKLSLYFLRHEEKLSTVTNPDTTEKTKQHILRTIAEIQERLKAGKNFEPIPSALCNWCGYRPMCPAWRHLYKKEADPRLAADEADAAIEKYFELKKTEKQLEQEIKILQDQIKAYMELEKLTRVFGKDGTVSKKLIQRYAYDLEKIKALLSPLNKWELILKADETKLKQILKEVPEDIRNAIMETRHVVREYMALSVSTKPVINPDNS